MFEEAELGSYPLRLDFDVSDTSNPYNAHLLRELYVNAHERFPDMADIFSEEGVSKDDLILSMRYISLVTHHDIKMVQSNKYTIIFYCGRDDMRRVRTLKPRKEKPASPDNGQGEAEAVGVGTDSTGEKRGPSEKSAVDKSCGFFLHFHKRRTQLWTLKMDERNSAGRGCVMCYTPTLCMHQSFVAKLIRDNIFYCSADDSTKPSIKAIAAELEAKLGIIPNKSTLKRAWEVAQEVDVKSILKQNQMVEAYVEELNKIGQFGSLLYSNGDLIVPNLDEDSLIVKHVDIARFSEQIPPPSAQRGVHYWDALPTKEPGSDNKFVSMTFQAVAVAMRAFQYSIPLICLNTCPIISQSTRGVMLTATFATTEFKLVTMCVGTAESESKAAWDFFLANLHHSLTRFCPELKWSKLVFISDKRDGVLEGVEKHFPGVPHLLCLISLLRSFNCPGNAEKYYWKAAEADNESDFQDSFQKLVKFVPRADFLLSMKEKWCRYAIATRCVRYGIRTNNWIDSQNNAMRFIRSGSILTVLYKSFEKISGRVCELHVMAEEQYGKIYESKHDVVTRHAKEVLERNIKQAFDSSFTLFRGGNKAWTVERTLDQKKFTVVIDGKDSTCSCLRYADEKIPCAHILFVFYQLKMSERISPQNLLAAFMDPIYNASLLLRAFPMNKAILPKPLNMYCLNESVILPEIKRKRGAPQILRFPSVGKGLKRPPHVSLAFPSRSDGGGQHKQASYEQKEEEGLNTGTYEYQVANVSEWRELQLMLAEGIEFPKVIFSPLELDSTSSDTCGSEAPEGSNSGMPGHNDILQRSGVTEKSVSSPDTKGDIRTVNSSGVLSNSMMIDGGINDACLHTDNYGPDGKSGLDCIDSGDGMRFNYDNADGEAQDIITQESNSESGFADRETKADRGTVVMDGTRIPSSVSLSLQGTHLGQVSDVGDGVDVQSLVQPPPTKCSKTTDSMDIHGGPSVMGNEKGKNEVPTAEKLGLILTHDDILCKRNEDLYLCIQGDRMNPTWFKENVYPSRENPALIPVIYPLPLNVISREEARGMDTDAMWPSGKTVPVIPSDVLIKFLAFVHSNTVAGLKSQAFVYSRSPSPTIRYLGILPQSNNLYSVSGINHAENQRRLFDSWNASESIPAGEGSFIMRCWIITHPTSGPFLSGEEIVQLYNYTRINPDCFGIVISPRSSGMKTLFVKLTEEGYAELKRLESQVNSPSMTAAEMNSYLVRAVSRSKVNFYFDIPCKLNKETCIVGDMREKWQIITQLATTISGGDVTHIW